MPQAKGGSPTRITALLSKSLPITFLPLNPITKRSQAFQSQTQPKTWSLNRVSITFSLLVLQRGLIVVLMLYVYCLEPNEPHRRASTFCSWYTSYIWTTLFTFSDLRLSILQRQKLQHWKGSSLKVTQLVNPLIHPFILQPFLKSILHVNWKSNSSFQNPSN